MPAELPVGTGVPIVRDGGRVVYQVVGDEPLIMDSEPAAHAAALYPKGAAHLAGWVS